MATNSGEANIPGSDGSDDDINEIQSNDPDPKASRRIVRPAREASLLLRIKADPRGTYLDTTAVILHGMACLAMSPPPETLVPSNLTLKETIQQLPAETMQTINEVALWFGDECNDGVQTGILDDLRAKIPWAKGNPAVKLHLFNTGEGNLPVSFFVLDRGATRLRPVLQLATLRLNYAFQAGFNDTMRQVFFYFRGTKAFTALALSNIGGAYLGDQLDVILGHEAVQRFRNLTRLQLRRHPGQIAGQPDWSLLARFANLRELDVAGSSVDEFVFSPWHFANEMAALRTVRLNNVSLAPMERSFFTPMPMLRTLEIGRDYDSPEITRRDIEQVCEAIRRGYLPDLRIATFSFHLNLENSLDGLLSVLDVISRNNCPKFERLQWSGSAIMVVVAGDVRRVFRRLSESRHLKQPLFVLELLSVHTVDDNVRGRELVDGLLDLVSSIRRLGLQQLKVAVRFIDPQPDWQQVATDVNNFQDGFTAEVKIVDIQALQEPAALLWIVVGMGPPYTNLLIGQREQ